MKWKGGLWLGAVCLAIGAVAFGAKVTKQQLTKKLWPRSRILAALKRVDELKALGMMSEDHYRRKRAMLEARLQGTFRPTMLAVTNPPMNFIQNAGFEEINRNSRSDRSRWLWWNGWKWGGDYENHWEDRPQFVHSGKYSARIQCTGKRGRIGIMTPKLPLVPGAKAYVFSIWAKGAGDNELFINFESGARGSFRERIGPQWRLVKVRGEIQPGADGYQVYLYATGQGTIWLDDAKLVPVGVKTDE